MPEVIFRREQDDLNTLLEQGEVSGASQSSGIGRGENRAGEMAMRERLAASSFVIRNAPYFRDFHIP